MTRNDPSGFSNAGAGTLPLLMSTALTAAVGFVAQLFAAELAQASSAGVQTPDYGTLYYTQNKRGDTVHVSDPAGARVAHLDYTPYGARDAAASSGNFDFRPQFESNELDASTGLYYFHARYLDPATGRFLEPDPEEQGASPFLYAGAAPTEYVDPDGRRFTPTIFHGRWVGGYWQRAIKYTERAAIGFGMGYLSMQGVGDGEDWKQFVAGAVGAVIGVVAPMVGDSGFFGLFWKNEKGKFFGNTRSILKRGIDRITKHDDKAGWSKEMEVVNYRLPSSMRMDSPSTRVTRYKSSGQIASPRAGRTTVSTPANESRVEVNDKNGYKAPYSAATKARIVIWPEAPIPYLIGGLPLTFGMGLIVGALLGDSTEEMFERAGFMALLVTPLIFTTMFPYQAGAYFKFKHKLTTTNKNANNKASSLPGKISNRFLVELTASGVIAGMFGMTALYNQHIDGAVGGR